MFLTFSDPDMKFIKMFVSIAIATAAAKPLGGAPNWEVQVYTSQNSVANQIQIAYKSKSEEAKDEAEAKKFIFIGRCWDFLYYVVSVLVGYGLGFITGWNFQPAAVANNNP